MPYVIRSNSNRSIRNIHSLQREGSTKNHRSSAHRSHRAPVVILNQVQEPSIFQNLIRHQKCLCAGATIYTALWIVLALCCIIQCVYRFHQFLYYPTTINVMFVQNETVTPPCVTICSSDLRHNRNPVIWPPYLREEVGDIKYNDTYDLMNKTNLTINQIWKMSRFAIKDMKYYIRQGNLWSGYQHYNIVSEQDYFTVNGICSTFKPREPLPCIGMLMGIKIKSKEDKNITKDSFRSYAITFHTEEEMPKVRYYGTLGTGVHLPFRQHIVTALKLKQLTYLDAWNDRCEEIGVASICVAKCLERYIIWYSNLTVPCRLPYMDQTSSLPPCVTAEEFLDIYTATQYAIRSVHVETECGCPKACSRIVYNANYFFKEPTTELFDIFVNFPDCEVELIEEETSYGITSLLSDIGGALGLFLGLSLLNLYDSITKMIQRKREGKNCCC